MAHGVDTPGVEGEIEATISAAAEMSISQHANLKTSIFEEFKNETVSNVIYSKLIENEITELDVLIFCDEKDLNKLCEQLSLSLGNSMKFKALIRKLKNKTVPSPTHNIVPITAEEQKEISKMESALNKSNNVYNAIETHYNEIEQHSILMKSEIKAQFEYLIESLQKRGAVLTNNVDQWKLGKMEAINAEISKIIAYNNALTKISNDINNLLKDNKYTIQQRTNKIHKMTETFFKNNGLFNTFSNDQLLRDYIQRNTELFAVQYQKNISLNNVSEFGIVADNVKNDMFSFPSISLKDIIKMTANENACKIKLRWDVISKQMTQKKKDNTSDFVMKYFCVNDTSEQKQNIFESDTIKWLTLEDSEIKLFVKSKYSSEIEQYFEYNKLYKFRVEQTITKPIPSVIVSNVKDFLCTKQRTDFSIDMSNAKQVPLSIHSHRGHYGANYKPENIFCTENNYYCSAKGVVTDDWIVLTVSESNAYFYPTKIKIRAWDGNASVKGFRFYIGNVKNKEWVSCNKEMFVSERAKGKKWQEFDLNVMKNEKSVEIYEHWYTDFKLELLNNHGNSTYVGLYEFQLYGVQYSEK